MKIKRKHYDRLQRMAQTRLRVYAVLNENTGQETALMDVTFEHLAMIARFGGDNREYMTGTFRLEFKCPETIAPMSPATPGHAPDYATETLTSAQATDSSQEGETTTASGKTGDASPPSVSHDNGSCWCGGWHLPGFMY